MPGEIPIRNLYMMLCYAWQCLPQSGTRLVGAERFDNIHQLLAALLASGTAELVRQGLGEEYTPRRESTATLRGRVLLHPTVAGGHLARRRLVCEYSVFSADTPPNQILKASLAALARCGQVEAETRRQLAGLHRYFTGVADIRLSPDVFAHLQPPKNSTYRLLMNVCELLACGLIAGTSGNTLRFYNFIQGREMQRLYEKFLLNFYRHHLPGSRYRVHSPQLRWQLATPPAPHTSAVLPRMFTDIVVEDRLARTQLILDAKYYVEPLPPGRQGKRSLRAPHLYQMHAYLANSTYPGAKSGMLLYPQTGAPLRHRVSLEGSDIQAWTVNLNAEWPALHAELLALVNAFDKDLG